MAPVITGLSRSSALQKGGEQLVVTGSGFRGTNHVYVIVNGQKSTTPLVATVVPDGDKLSSAGTQGVTSTTKRGENNRIQVVEDYLRREIDVEDEDGFIQTMYLTEEELQVMLDERSS
ncbi:IPT/TIG domain-containing protein [Nocardia cyriacigeorgica]|uniref:IPT/TIG domain-containing protein n=1 Tax=Nocardia cyriacigeorgica TaxID=135487 RepID=A0A6P1DBW8_9NOCA|nr:IPT/TIG domain-containing protein [Nocardia cyriacigeorgica]NEW37866.1 hypothetical protein [Nocardia cyriacigeorgica]NEW47987.1 hypothetical protein [Nocardia cyriacigeorgica]